MRNTREGRRPAGKDDVPLILVAEDAATSRLAIERQLGALGCEVDCAADGIAALAAIQARVHDLVLLDCYLPGLRGEEIARRVRRREAADATLGYLPLIGISASLETGHVRHCLESGMDGVLGKPIPIQALRRLLDLWCDYQSEAKRGQEAGAASASDPAGPELVDLDRLFEAASREDLQSMRAALAACDAAALRSLTHRMRGAALTMRRQQIVNLLDRIDDALADQPAGWMAIASCLAGLEDLLAA